ncbi:transposase InsO family protein [Microlunatus parietis]|uniref:Transposase InsO family protein n=1 Tax=Microlunatus parietis TaxID=682979 RepID=A0A7Y9IE37_9ACTN|nr:integrase core domain-containing protein [Microlunatus parietis]NYE72857.1 transposase InsO family protein [Microlunatus parietis]NYE75085.1 transposase InsO family protein [Microlunatus parietis]
MADRVVSVDIRVQIAFWPEDAPRGAVSRFCERHKLSRSWFYELRARARAEDPAAAVQPRSRSWPQGHPLAVGLEIEELAVRLRKELRDQGCDYGPVSVRFRMDRLGVTPPAASTLARIFSRRGMVVPQPQKRPRSAVRRFVFALVHECWQLDAFDWVLAADRACVIFQLVDDHSRFMIASLAAWGETVEAAILVVDRGIAAFQVPCLLLTDNGSALNQTRIGRRSRLVDHLTGLGCRPITGRPGHPQTQGKDERVHQTVQRWLRARPRATSLAELQAQLDQFDRYYNHDRGHQALGLRTPAEVMAAGPVAVPPVPAPPAPAPARPARSKQPRVAANGSVRVDGVRIQLGREHAKTTVTTISTGQTVTIFDGRGRHLRTQVLEPGKTYYSNGRPRGGRLPLLIHQQRQRKEQP